MARLRGLKTLGLFLSCSIALGACSSGPRAYTPSDEDECGSIEQLGEVTVVEFGGKRFQAALLVSRSQRITGLLHACELPPDGAGLFVMPRESKWSFHMDGMSQDLDIAFFNSSGDLVGYFPSETGQSDISPEDNAKYVLEIAHDTFPPEGPPTGRRLVPLAANAPTNTEIHRRACDQVINEDWSCPLPKKEGGPEMEVDNLYRGTNSTQVSCAARVADCVAESEEFGSQVAQASFRDGGYKNLGNSHGALKGDKVYHTMVEWSSSAPRTTMRSWSGAGAWLFRSFNGSTAVTNLGTGPIKLNTGYVSNASVDRLVATVVHEWLHVLGFRDPASTGDSRSVVYGTEAIVRELALKVLAHATAHPAPTTPAAPAAGPSTSDAIVGPQPSSTDENSDERRQGHKRGQCVTCKNGQKHCVKQCQMNAGLAAVSACEGATDRATCAEAAKTERQKREDSCVSKCPKCEDCPLVTP